MIRRHGTCMLTCTCHKLSRYIQWRSEGGAGGDICPRAQGFRGRQNRQFALRKRARGARALLTNDL